MNKAFTLAEVLITLMIIGIVAALTIPSVISNYQQQEFKTGLKKAVSVLNEAIQTNIAQEGETPYENWDLFTYLQRHMNVIKSIDYVGRCVKSASDRTPFDVEKEGGEACGVNSAGTLRSNRVFYTTDGMRFEIPVDGEAPLYLHESGTNIFSPRHTVDQCPPNGCYSKSALNGAVCGSYGLTNNANNTIWAPCLMVVDVNGDKKPNVLETSANSFSPYLSFYRDTKSFYLFPSLTDKKLSDIFTIMITEEKAIPFGVVAQRAMYSK